MKYGVSCPNFEAPSTVVDLAAAAEGAGWDGFFIWDHVRFLTEVDIPIVDPWVTLGAAAARTVRIRLGPLVTALPRRRPWKVARESATLDHLSNGRAILGVGAGWPADGDFETFAEDADLGVRAEKLDEALEIVQGLWSAERFSFEGKHYQVSPTTFIPPPVQQPRIPIWVAATWPRPGPVRRAAAWDGIVPLNPSPGENPPLDMVRRMVVRCRELRRELRRGQAHFDVVLSGTTEPDSRVTSDLLAEYDAAGATWWLETTAGMPGWDEALMKRIHAGRPE